MDSLEDISKQRASLSSSSHSSFTEKIDTETQIIQLIYSQEKERFKSMHRHPLRNQQSICLPFEVQLSSDTKTPTYYFLHLTNYRMVFEAVLQTDKEQLSLPYGYIKDIDSERDSLKITLKTGLCYRIKAFINISQVHQLILHGLVSLPFCQHTVLPRENSQDYDYFAEMERMRISWDNLVVVSNDRGKLCTSYPRFIVTPKEVSLSLLEECCKTRSHSRVPVLTYYHEASAAGLWRASKLKVGSESNKYNQAYLQSIDKNILLIDHEDELINTHFQTKQSLRNIYHKAVLAYAKDEHVLRGMQKWIQDVHQLLSLAYLVAEHLLKGKTVLLQEGSSDDRVTQISAITQVLIDPFYRSFRGLGVLIEKQFVSFGHPFSVRTGHQREQIQEMCPTFVEFLECLHQLINSYPQNFQYSPMYLAKIAYQVYTTRYNDFLFKNCHEKQASKQSLRTLTIWKNLPIQLSHYSIPFALASRGRYKQAEDEKEDNNLSAQRKISCSSNINWTELVQKRRCPSILEFVIWREYFDMVSKMKAEEEVEGEEKKDILVEHLLKQ